MSAFTKSDFGRPMIGARIRCIVLLVCWIASIAGLASHAAGQASDDPVLAAWTAFPATYSCRRCHYESQPVPNYRFDDAVELQRGDFAGQNEMYRWVREDKHAIARIRIEPLLPGEVQTERTKIAAAFAFTDPRGAETWVGPSNVLSRRICDALGIDIERPAGYQQFAEACLTCHGGYDPAAGPQPSFSKAEDLTKTQPGISCLACHQEPAGSGVTANAWILEHASLTDPQQRAWRLLTPQAKAAKGMRDLVTTSKQADLCIDCHVGNLTKGMFVTHAMYAAGHPPLPNFELETFCRAMPRHWRSEDELLAAFEEAKYPGTSQYFAINAPGLTNRLSAAGGKLDDIAWTTRRALIGAAAVRRRGAETVVWAAESDSVWGDYAFYDCSACHHELRRPSLRQSRGFPGLPGRPRLHEWPDILLQVVGPSSAAASAQQRLTSTVSAIPFGNAVACRDAAQPLVVELQKAISNIESDVVIGPQHAWRVIQRLSGTPRELLIDYATGRQVMWLIMIAADDLAARPQLSPTERRRLQDIRAEIARWSAMPTEGGTLVSSGSVGIATDLPAGRGMFIFRENLQTELERRAEYEPGALYLSLQRIERCFADPTP